MAERESPDEKRSGWEGEEACRDEEKAGRDEATSSGDGRGRGLKPVAEKIGEDGDNLRRREEWYRRRSGAM